MRRFNTSARILRLLVLATAAAVLGPQPIPGQQFFWDSAGVVPGNLSRIEYENLKALRNMPHFQALQKAYAGNFAYLERWLGAFGLREENVTELLVGREGEKEGGHTFAIAQGEFYPVLPTTTSSPYARLVPTKIGDLEAYCEGPAPRGGSCVVFQGQSWAALGRMKFLEYIAENGDGLTEPLSSEPQLMDLVAMIPSDAPLWGVARGGAALMWLKAVIPFADSVPIVWSTLVDGLDGMTYSVTPREDTVEISVNLKFTTSSHASVVGAIFEGIKSIERVMWTRGNQGGPNPFSDTRVDVDDRTVSLGLSTSYQELASGVPLGPQ